MALLAQQQASGAAAALNGALAGWGDFDEGEDVNFDAWTWERRYLRGSAPEEWYAFVTWPLVREVLRQSAEEGRRSAPLLLCGDWLAGCAAADTASSSPRSAAPPAAAEGGDGLLNGGGSPRSCSPAAAPRAGQRCLVLGCGLSRLGEEIADGDPMATVVNVDISQTAIAEMQRRCNCRADGSGGGVHGNLTFLVADALHLPFADGTFHRVVDKATFDCMMCSSAKFEDVPRYLREVLRLLSCGDGEYINISTSEPLRAIPWLRDCRWTTDYWTVRVPHPAAAAAAASPQTRDKGAAPSDDCSSCWPTDDDDDRPAAAATEPQEDRQAVVWSPKKASFLAGCRRGRSLPYYIYRCQKTRV